MFKTCVTCAAAFVLAVGYADKLDTASSETVSNVLKEMFLLFLSKFIFDVVDFINSVQCTCSCAVA